MRLTTLGLSLSLLFPITTFAEPIHLKEVGFATPESVEYEPTSDTYLVANINGSPFEKDGNGFISQVSPDGKVIQLKWLDGSQSNVSLDAPKGMVVQSGRLFIADIDRVRVFDLNNQQQLDDIVFPGSSFINGLSPAKNGGLYVTDSGMKPGFKPSGTDALYHVTADGNVTQLKQGVLGLPNGVYAEGDQLWMVSLGSGQLRVMNLKGEETARMTLPFNRLDGLLTNRDGRLFTSSWAAEGVFEILPDYTVKKRIGNLTSPADMGYDPQRDRLLIPLFLKNELVILPLE